MRDRLSRLSSADFGLLPLCLVLLIAILYLIFHEMRTPTPGFHADPYSWKVENVSEPCLADPRCVRTGDTILRLGTLTQEEFKSDRSIYLFRDLETSEGPLEVQVMRDGRAVEARVPPEYWIRKSPGNAFAQAAFPLIFWFVGTIAVLFLRPHDERWLVLVALCYSTSFWGASGFISGVQYGLGPEIFHVAIWIFMPLLIHLHLVMPRPIFPELRRWLLPLLYGAALLLIVLDWVYLISRVPIALVLLACILFSLGLTVRRLAQSQDATERMATRLVLFGVGLGVFPVVLLVVVLSFVSITTSFRLFSDLFGFLFAFILPLWPFSYLYALYKHGPTGVEFRANRLLGAYGFFSIYITLFITCFIVAYGYADHPEHRAALSLGVSLTFVVLAPMLRRRFQRFVESTIYGVRYRPQDVLAAFARGIPSAIERNHMREVIERDILPTLMVRRSALFLLDDDARDESVDVVYRQEVEDTPTTAELQQLLGATKVCSNLEMGGNPRFPWLRLLVPLHATTGEDLGAWMLGRRDPDDYYPRSDIDLMANLANQLAPVIENARLVERARQEVKENRRLQAQLVQSQKMEAIGRLSAGIAHDFNNLLSVILGYSSMLLTRYSDDERLTKYLGDIKDAGHRAAALTRQLLTFSRQQVMEPRVMSLNTVITDVNKMLQRLTGEDVDVVTELGETLPRVRIDPGQMGQVLMNLTVNARDAMPDGGRLRIRTSEVSLARALEDPQQARIPPGRYVLLEFDDDGVGIEPEFLSRIFEPYFTTKDHGKGTGLGLSMVYGIVNQSRGFIRVDLKADRPGTRFCVYLPVVERADDRDESEVALRRPVPKHGDETILVVEDEESVRTVTCEMLRGSGYSVLEAADGPSALDLVQQNSVEVDLLLTDVIMPQMKGTELARRLSTLRPELKVVFMSGYNEESILGRRLGEAGTVLLPKPFSPGELSRTVREVLDS